MIVLFDLNESNYVHMSEHITSIIEYFYKWESEEPERVFLRQPQGDSWNEMTYGEAGQEARKMASVLLAKGLKPGDHVGIYSKNCMHWILADLAIMISGMVSVPYYSSLPKDQLKEVIDLSDIKALFIGRLDKWGDRDEAISPQLNVIKFPRYDDDVVPSVGENWDDLIAKAAPLEGKPSPDLDTPWTIKFTSGTTGTPKGVVHNHRNPALLMHNERKTNWVRLFQMKMSKFFSFLPLNHVAERVGVEIPAITIGGSISFAQNLASFPQNIRDTQPSMVFAVPRIWTKFYQGVTSKIPEKRLDFLLKVPLVSAVVKRKLLTGMGLKDVEIAATGAAITPAFIKEFFAKLDIQLIEAYGMTETLGSIVNAAEPGAPSDSVGRALPGAKVKIDEESGEIMMHTPYMMAGYYNSPEKTAEVLNDDGWLHSGDIGEIDDNGYLRVTGRVKDAFKTSKGSFVTPNPLEEAIAQNEFVEQVCVVGLGIPQPIALLNLGEAAEGRDASDVADSLVQTVKDLNASRANYEAVSTVVIQKEAWTDQNGFLTPTLKVKRTELDKAYGQQYLDWHESPDAVIWE
ncbi:MAG: AMP-binding protein [Gammaproteobacteria bacterium]|nr:AMP-binding protein [Gammaproteobacteria bacterium]